MRFCCDWWYVPPSFGHVDPINNRPRQSHSTNPAALRWRGSVSREICTAHCTGGICFRCGVNCQN